MKRSPLLGNKKSEGQAKSESENRASDRADFRRHNRAKSQIFAEKRLAHQRLASMVCKSILWRGHPRRQRVGSTRRRKDAANAPLATLCSKQSKSSSSCIRVWALLEFAMKNDSRSISVTCTSSASTHSSANHASRLWDRSCSVSNRTGASSRSRC